MRKLTDEHDPIFMPTGQAGKQSKNNSWIWALIGLVIIILILTIKKYRDEKPI